MNLSKFYFYLAIIFIAGLNFVKAEVSVNLVIDAYGPLDEAFQVMVDLFNSYSKENSLDVNLKLTYFTYENDGEGYNDYTKTLSLFGKKNKNNKYDIFAYDTLYLNVFSPYLLELDEYLPKDFTDLYSSEINRKLTFSDGHIRGFPLALTVSILFSNMDYLEKYGMEIPKTWDELIQTSQHIIEEEKKLGNNELYGYNGLFPYNQNGNNENAMCSFLAFLYSFRDNVDDDIPEITSKNARKAIEKLLEIRDKISSAEVFTLQESQAILYMINKRSIFSTFYNILTLPPYQKTVMPGKKEGINASVIGGFNIGINKNSSEEKRRAALEVVKFLNSKEFQKSFIVQQLGYISSIEEIYNDPEVCATVDCEMVKSLQYYFRPITKMPNYDDYSKRTIINLKKLFDNQITIDEFLKNVDDINNVYSVTINSALGAITFSILIFITCLVLATSCLVFIPKVKPYFKFLSTDLWVMYSVGCIFILVSIFLYFGVPTISRCIISQELLVNGYSFILIPLLYKLITNFPLLNSFSTKATNNKYLYIFGLYFVQLVLTILSSSLGIYEIDNVNLYNENKTFHKCVNNTTFGKVLSFCQIGYDAFMYIAICVLVFFEWNITETFFDIRHFSLVLIINGITSVLLVIINNISINDYLSYNSLFIFVSIIFVIISHNYIFIVRVLISYHTNKYNQSEEKAINDMMMNNRRTVNSTGKVASMSEDGSTSSRNSGSTKNIKKGYKSRLIDIHYATMASQDSSQISSHTARNTSQTSSQKGNQSSSQRVVQSASFA